MNILIISPFSIYPPYLGFATRVYNLMNQLSTQNKVHFLYVDLDEKHIEGGDHEYLHNVTHHRIRASKKWMQLFHPFLIFSGLKIIKNEDIDLIIAEGMWAALHSIILHIFTKVPYYFNEHNAEYIRWKRIGKKYCSLIKIYEKICCKYADKIFCVSSIDREFIGDLGIDLNKIIVIPNGVDTTKFKPNPINRKKIRMLLNISEKSPVILFFGYFGYYPNIQAVEVIHDILLEKIVERIPNSKFLIVGSNPPLKYNNNSILFTGSVDNIEEYINASDVVIAPLLSGGGTKLKVLESIACGKTVVATSIAAEGLIGEESNIFLLVNDDWDIFVDYIIESLQNTEMKASPLKFVELYSWNSIGKVFCDEICKNSSLL